jgi:branched-chain amino acid transport system permease protein
VRDPQLEYRTPGYLPRGLVAGVLLLGAVTLFVVFERPSSVIYHYNLFLLYGIAAVALNLLMGTAGQVSLGTAGFFAAGAFGSVFFQRAGIPFPLDVVLASLVGALVGLIVGVPSLRLRGIYLALATLAAHFTILYVALRYQNAKAGPGGFSVDQLFSNAGVLREQQYWAAMLFGLLAITMIVFARLSRHRTGRAWRMVRDHEVAAPAVGINVTRYKLASFVISSAVITGCGGLLARINANASAEAFTLDIAILVVAMIVVGGMDSVIGAVIGAGIITALPLVIPGLIDSLLPESRRATSGPQVAVVIYGALIVVLVTRSPGGIVGWLRGLTAWWTPRLRQAWARSFAQR